MLEILTDTLARPNFIAFVALFLCGLYIAITHHNLVKKVIGLYLVQTSVLFVLVTFSARQGATVPILVAGQDPVRAQRLRESAAPRPDADRHRGRRGDPRCRAVAGGGDLSRLRQPGRGRDPEEAGMKSQLPALIFSIPLFAAISMPMISVWRPRWCRPMALGAAAAMAVTAILNLALVIRFGETRYVFGGWAAPLGIEWVADAAAGLVVVAVAVIATVCLAYEGSVRLEASGSRVSLHYVLILLLAVGPDRRGVRRRPLQRVRVPGGGDAGHLRPHRHRRGQGAGLRVPLPDTGHHRGYLLPARRELPVRRDRHAEHGRHGRAARPAGGIQRGDHRRGVHVPGPGDQDGADAVSRLAARCLHPGAGRDLAAHLGPGHQGVAVCLDPDHVLGARCRRRVGAGPGAPRLLDAGRGRRRSSGRFSPSSSTTSSACSPTAACRTSG